MEITNRDDLRVGDVATFAFNGHEFTGPLWTEGGESLYIGGAFVRYPSGRWSTDYTFVRATREAPPLPTEPGAVIYVTECRGERVDEPVLAVGTGGGEWVTFGYEFDDCAWHLSANISAWSPAKVVPA